MITIKFSDIIFNFEINDIMGIELVHTNSYPKISGMISTYYDIGVRIDTKSVPNYLKTLYCQCDKYHNIEKISENPELLEVVNRILIVNKNDWSDFIYNEDIHDGVVNVGIPMSIYNGFDDEKYRYYSNKADNIYDYKNYLRIIRLYDSDNFIIDNFYKLLRINHYMNIVIYIPSKYDIDMNSNFSFNEYDVYSLNLSDMNRMYVSTKAKAIKNLSKYFDFLLIRYDDSNKDNYIKINNIIDDKNKTDGVIADRYDIIIVPFGKRKLLGDSFTFSDFDIIVYSNDDDIDDIINKIKSMVVMSMRRFNVGHSKFIVHRPIC